MVVTTLLTRRVGTSPSGRLASARSKTSTNAVPSEWYVSAIRVDAPASPAAAPAASARVRFAPVIRLTLSAASVAASSRGSTGRPTP